jgi:hypothetical protein
MQTYGFEELLTLTNFDKLNVLSKAARKSDWIKIRKSLRLFTEKLDLANPTDINFTYAGYAPLSVRLLELSSIPGAWKRNEELIKEIPGIGFDYKQENTHADGEKSKDEIKVSSAATEVSNAASAEDDSDTKKKPVTLVYFIGGITFGEIAAIRYLSEQKGHGRDYIIATTKLINGASFIESMREIMPNKLETV